MARLIVQAGSPSAQAKAAAVQVGGRNWNWRKNLSCPTIEVISLTPPAKVPIEYIGHSLMIIQLKDIYSAIRTSMFGILRLYLVSVSRAIGIRSRFNWRFCITGECSTNQLDTHGLPRLPCVCISFPTGQSHYIFDRIYPLIYYTWTVSTI